MTQVVPPGVATMESTAHHLQVSARRLQDAVRKTPLEQIKPISLGRSRGTYRLIPQLGIALLRQVLSVYPFRLALWEKAVCEVLGSSAWRQTTKQIIASGRMQWPPQGGSGVLEAMLTSPALGSLMEALQQESTAALMRHGLSDFLQLEDFMVDRLEDEEFAVALIGSKSRRAYLLPRAQLQLVGLDREKARGVLMATRTSRGIDLDVWPAIAPDGSEEWQVDPDLLKYQVEVGAGDPIEEGNADGIEKVATTTRVRVGKGTNAAR